ncbi:MAG: hypothetical protein KDD82_28145 [Planctomycetes bacterium]|nr:hypothetical protein [Planctomycetota bacterium]
MGLTLSARCAACGYDEDDIKLGATHQEIAQHDVCTREVYVVSCCTRLASLLIYLGQPLPADLPCPHCERPVDFDASPRLPIATLSGVRLTGHPCPRCGAAELGFTELGRFV